MKADTNAGRAPRPDAGPLLTHVELTWLEGRIEHWIRFGHDASETILDRRRRVLSYAPNSVFAFVRWASNDFGTIVSRIDIVRAIDRREVLSDAAFRPSRRRDSAADQRVAESRARAAGDRCRRGTRHRCR